MSNRLPEIDPTLSLAFSMHSSKGVYALLLGSGISRTAGIPTGWEIVIDFIRKLAQLQDESCEPDPAAWYKGKYGKTPDYSNILDVLAKSSTERLHLLKRYFEPTEEEAEQGLKTPTKAHKAIAKLVSHGYVRVILTTNFDRLMERALEDQRVAPTVISSPDAIGGAIPLIHSEFTLVKLHGDYLDTRLKNTEQELEIYDPKVDELLDRIFDEYGLVVSGWSVEWDAALRRAIERCPNRRFSSYWTYLTKPSEAIQKLATFRQGQLVKIPGADEFFTDLHEKVSALENIRAKHPLSLEVAIARVKRYVVDDRYRILLHDMVTDETEALYRELETEFSPDKLGGGTPFTSKELNARVTRYGELTKVLLNMMLNGCYWGNERHMQLWERTITRIANPPCEQSGLEVWLKLCRYPALLLLYGAGMAALLAANFKTLKSLYSAKVRENSLETSDIVLQVIPQIIIDHNIARKLPGLERHHTPVSDLLFDVLREPLRALVPSDSEYQELFDRFEYLNAIQYAVSQEQYRNSRWFPAGCYAWRERLGGKAVAERITAEVNPQQDSWPPFKVGLYGGNFVKFTELQNSLTEFIPQLNFH